jgi:hypothetical protein
MAETIWISVGRRDKEGWMVLLEGHTPSSLACPKHLLEDYLQSSLNLPGSGCAVVLTNLR